jgi:hypothetical protein
VYSTSTEVTDSIFACSSQQIKRLSVFSREKKTLKES